MSFSKEVKEELLSNPKLNKVTGIGENFEKALVLNAFLNTGSINNPNNVYHLEIEFQNLKNAENISRILNKINVNSNIIRKKK